jgi:aminocarboxymuconate-semialdehyde decarboxylase
MRDDAVTGPGRAPAGGAWDVHAHVIPPSVVAAARSGSFGLRIDGGRLVIGGSQLPLAPLTDRAALVDWLDARRLAGAILSVPPALYRYDLAAADAVGWVQLVNEGLREVVRAAPGRLRVLASLPLQIPSRAAALIEGLEGDVWAGVAIGSSVGERALDDPALGPVFAAADRAAHFIFVRPVEAPDPRLDHYYLGNLLGNPYETSLAAACLIFSGMVERYPNIRFCLAHAGGAAPFLIGRWQQGYATERQGIAPLALPPVRALRRLWFDSITHGDAALALLVDVAGADRVLLGSDYPFPMGDGDPLAALWSLPPHQRDMIASGNVRRILDHSIKVGP